MEFVKDKVMYLIIQDTPFNRIYHNYKKGDICDCVKEHNPKYVNYKKAKRKIIKTPREKRIVFMESLHERVRKSINPELPSRLSSIILYKTAEDCYKLAKKWEKNTGCKPLVFAKVKCEGKLHACATTPDEQKSDKLIKDDHVAGITRFWMGDENAETQECFFQGKAEVVEILDFNEKNIEDKDEEYGK